MHLVTFTFDVHREDQAGFKTNLKALKVFWKSHGVEYALYQDKTTPTRFLLTLDTEKSVDEITALLQKNTQARSVFEIIKSSAGRVAVSFLDRVV